MKKLLGLMAIAPMGLAACGGSGYAHGEEPSDNFQTMVTEVSLAEAGMGSKDDCEHYGVQSAIDNCETYHAEFSTGDSKDMNFDITFTDWKTNEEDSSGIVKVEVTVKTEMEWTGSVDYPGDVEDTTENMWIEFEKDSNDDWKIMNGGVAS